MEFTFTSFPLNFYTSIFGCCCGFRFEQIYLRIDGFGGKRQESADLHIPIYPRQSKSLIKGIELMSTAELGWWTCSNCDQLWCSSAKFRPFNGMVNLSVCYYVARETKMRWHWHRNIHRLKVKQSINISGINILFFTSYFWCSMRVSMGLTVNRQMAKKLTVNRQKRNIFAVNRQMSEPKLAVKFLRYP